MANMNEDEIKMIEGFFTDGSKSESSLLRFQMNKDKSSPNELSLNLTITSRDGHRRFDKKKQDTGQESDKGDRAIPRIHKDPRTLLKNPIQIAASELDKFNQSVQALQRKGSELLSLLQKSQRSRNDNLDIQSLKSQAYMDMNLLRLQAKRHHRQQNSRQQFIQMPRQAQHQVDRLRQEVTSLTNSNKEKEGEIQRLKGIIERMSEEVQEKENCVGAMEGRVAELEGEITGMRENQRRAEEGEVRGVMESMLAEVEHRNSIDILNNEIRIMSDKIANLCQEIQKTNMEKSNLFTKTKSLEDRLKFAEQSTRSKIASNSKHSISISNENIGNQWSFSLDPSDADIQEWINMFTQYHSHFHTKCKVWNHDFKQKYGGKPTNKDREMEPIFYLKNNFNNILTELKSIVIHREKCPKQNKSPLKQVHLQLQRNNPHNNSSILTTLNHMEKPREVRALECEVDLLKKSLDSVKKDRTRLETENQNLMESLKAMQAQLMNRRQDSISVIEQDHPKIVEYEKKLEQLNNMFLEQKHKLKVLLKRRNELTEKCQNLEITIKDLQYHLEKQICQRRKLHNQVEDLKGNIRVYCRVRPLISSEIQRDCKNIIQVDFDSIIISGKNKKCEYDAVFSQDSSQQQIFEDTKKLVQSAIDGYNVCIFAYGQTGSGKTFTLHGTEQQPGISHRAIEQLYRLIQACKHTYEVKVEMNMIEVYLDNIYDLCDPDGKPLQKPLQIAEDPKTGATFVKKSYKIKVNSAKQMEDVYKNALKNRKTSSTDMNSQSSRSHLIFMIFLEIQNKKTGLPTNGKLSIVDLAGSERATKSALKSSQMKESQSINRSLTALNDVIVALNCKDKHIPYRNHKLTYLLKDSLGGNSKTLMFVNVSPADYNIQETFTSLQFANRVKNTERSAASINVQRDRTCSQEEGRRSLTKVEHNLSRE